MKWVKTVLIAAGVVVITTMLGCESEGPAEKAGERVDEAVEELTEPQGPAEEAADAVEESVEETKEGLKEAKEEAGEAIEETGEKLQ